MATSNLTFTKNALNRWACKFSSSGAKNVVQLEKAGCEPVTVYANLTGMAPVAVFTSGRQNTDSVIFEIDMPEGVEVTVESMDEVITAKISG